MVVRVPWAVHSAKGGSFNGKDLLVRDGKLGIGLGWRVGGILVDVGGGAQGEEVWDAEDVVWVPVGEEGGGYGA